MRSPTPLREIFTGRPRPRHLRFAAALAELVPGTKLERRDQSLLQRIRTNAVCRLTGVREVDIGPGASPVVLHQALTAGGQPYAAEFDVPLAIHGYSYSQYMRRAERARRLLESPALKTIFVFSDWARRSFALYFGDEVGAKCRVSYPLAAPQARFGGENRRYDFTFISTQFRIKCGPEVIKAFAAVRATGAPGARMCVVTNLDEARQKIGDLNRFPGVEWREANLNQQQIAELLSDSHCFVHPSPLESFGVVVLEAIAAGCAVIASDMASFPEMVTGDNGTLLPLPVGSVVGGFWIPQFSDMKASVALLERLNLSELERDLAEAMVSLATNPQRRASQQQASRDLYDRQFSPAAWQDRMRKDLGSAFPELKQIL